MCVRVCVRAVCTYNMITHDLFSAVRLTCIVHYNSIGRKVVTFCTYTIRCLQCIVVSMQSEGCRVEVQWCSGAVV